MTKLKKSLRKVVKLMALLSIREGYLLARNVYGVVEHPFLTFKRIYKEKDLSQGLLIFGLPAVFWFFWLFVLLASRIFFFGRLHFGFLAKASFLASSLVVSVVFLFLGYWGWMVWKKERRGK